MRMPQHSTVAAYAALFVCLGGGAYAATSFVDKSGQIRACVKRSGAMYADKDGKCGRKETALVWNQRGPQGPAGPAGSDPQTIEIGSFVQKAGELVLLGGEVFITAPAANTPSAGSPSRSLKSRSHPWMLGLERPARS